MRMLSSIMTKTSIGALAVGAMLALTPMKADAALVHYGDNLYTGTLSPAETIATPIDLADGYFTFGGITGGTIGGLTFDIFNSGTTAQSKGSVQLLLSSASSIVIDKLDFGGVSLLPLGPITGGYGALFSATLPQNAPGLEFDLQFSSANQGDAFHLTISPVPLPAGGLLLLTALGGVAVLRRKRKAA